jgi:hypothetical protein
MHWQLQNLHKMNHPRDGKFGGLHSQLLTRWPVAIAFVGTLFFVWAVYGGFFPGPNGLGHDYSFFLPDLLSNYQFAKVNGPWFAPWFTPAFCGGQPAFADPQSLYYSLPQLLVAFFDPVMGVFWTLQTFAALGFLGTYLFLHSSLKASRSAAIVGGVLFAINGFFTHRMLVGHLAFHGFMLVPLLAWTATSCPTQAELRSPKTWGGVLLGTLIVGYWVHSGMAVLLLPALVAVLILLCIHGLCGSPFFAPLVQLACSIGAGIALGASKVVASLAYAHQFPRDGYVLGGFPTAGESMRFAVESIFFGPEHISAISGIQLAASRHEYEFGLTPVAAILLACGGVLWLTRWLRGEKQAPEARAWRLVFVLLVLASVPILLNTAFGPQWEALLKSIPIIKSSSTLLRWYVLYIPMICIAAALCLDVISEKARLRSVLALAAVACIGLLHSLSDLRFYAGQPYDPRPVQGAFEKARTSTVLPNIKTVAVMVDAEGHAIAPLDRNDLLIYDASALLCYNPMFGYGLESFPMGTLHPGPALEENDGYLNIKNPSCYLYPSENTCAPGSHFSAAQRAEASAFLGFREFPFKISALQQIANWLSLVAATGLAAWLAWTAGRCLRK